MKNLALALIFCVTLGIDFAANVMHVQSVGWDWTATLVAIWVAIEWRRT